MTERSTPDDAATRAADHDDEAPHPDLEDLEAPADTSADEDGAPAEERRAFWQGDTPTEPMPIVERLRHTPYRLSRPAEQLPVIDTEEQAAVEAMDFALRLGELMLRSGAAASRVEASVIAVGAAAGLRRLDVDITLQSLHMQCVLRGGKTVTRLRVVQGARHDFARLDAIHQLVDEIVAHGWDAARAHRQLRELRTRPRTWSQDVVLVSTGVLVGAVTMMLGAGWVAVLVAAASGMTVHRLTRFLGRHGYPEFYQMAFGAFVATSIAWIAYALGVNTPVPVSGSDFAFMVAGGIVILLPGRATAAAVEDVISGYQVTGAGRILAVILNTSGLTVGVGGALTATLTLTDLLGRDFVSPEVLDLRSFVSPGPATFIGAFILGMSAAINAQARKRLIVPIGLLCMTGVAISRLVTETFGLGITIASGAAAVVIGVVGRLLASRFHSTAMTFLVPASFGLLPGLAIFRGLYEMVSADASSGPMGELTVQNGLTTILGAFATLLAISTGTMLGELLTGPIDHRWSKARWDRRRRRQG